MNDRQHARRDEEANKDRSPVRRRDRRETPEAASILDLQGSVGNRAVARLIESREGEEGAVRLQRQPADKAPRANPADEGETSTARTMSIKDMKLEVPLQSFSQQVGNPQEPKRESGQVVVTIALKDFDPRISESVAKGRHFETITIKIGSKTTVTLSGVVFSSLSMGSDIVSLSLDFTSSEFHRVPDREPPDYE